MHKIKRYVVISSIVLASVAVAAEDVFARRPAFPTSGGPEIKLGDRETNSVVQPDRSPIFSSLTYSNPIKTHG